MKTPLVVAAVALLCSSISHAATLPAAEDSSSSRGLLTNLTNKAATLRVDSTHTGYVYFNLSDVPATNAAQIRYARLRFYLPKIIAKGGGATVHVVSSPWDEAVPSAAPAHDPTPTVEIDGTAFVAKHFASVDVTNAVRAWVAGSVQNQGFAIVAGTGTVVFISSKEGSGSGYPAELDVELNPDAGAITAAQLASDLTLAGTTTGTFSGNGAGLSSLAVANLVGQLTNTQLANSSLTVTAGSGLGGGGAVSLGDAITLTNAGVTSLSSGGGGITVSGSTGAITLGSNATSTNTAGTLVMRDANGNFAAGMITGDGFGLTNLNAANITGQLSSSQLADGAVSAAKLGSDVGLWSASGTTFVFRDAGNVGIGMTDAATNAKLYVKKSGAAPVVTGISETAVFQNDADATDYSNVLNIFGSAGGGGYWLGKAGSTFRGGIGYNNADDSLGIWGNDLERIHIISSGDVGIGRTPSGFKLDVNGSIRCVGAVNTSSDARFKLDIQPLDGALAKITKLRGVSYEWNREAFPEKQFSNGRQIGFIAQELAPILPEVVTQDGEGYLSVAYSALVPVLVEAVKEQQQTITTLEARVEALEKLVRPQTAQ